MNKIMMLLVLLTFSSEVMPQGPDTFIQKVLEKHPGILAEKELLLSREAESQAGYTPPNPNISMGYFPGLPREIGEKITWSVSQSLDLPARYRRLKTLGRNNYEQSLLEYHNKVLAYLSDIRSRTIELVALRKQIEVSEERLEHIRQMEDAYKKMLDEGEVTIIDFNKIMLTGAGMKNTLLGYRNREDAMLAFLDMVSGNNASLLDRSGWPLFEEPEADRLLEEKRAMHPAFKIPGKEIEIAASRLDVVKTKSMPGFQLGFASEIVAASEFTGPTLGISIPLWENKGRIAAEKAKISHHEAEYHNIMLVYENEFRTQYARYLSVKNGLRELRNAYDQSASKALLNKSLEEGGISVIEYFTELAAFYSIEDRIIDLEREYYILLSDLYDHFPGLIIPQN
ncbi:MAG: TolC family protein [Bacteroidales bacterium]|nr:TolC family protein [Bacteroidales bacterium]